MVPSLYAYLPALPLTEWGKIDHSALPSPAEALAGMRDPTPTSGGAAQGSDTQDKLTAIVAEILQLPDFGPDDDFFMLGMTSLTMARLLRTVSAELDVELQPLDVFELPTISSLTHLIEQTPAGQEVSL
jgi:acyl carrier protein